MGLVPQRSAASVETYGLSYIRPYHREIARRLVLGQKQSDICRDLGMSVSRMSIIINSPLFKLELKRLETMRDNGVGEVTQQLKELSPVALETVERIMYGAKSDRLKLDAAETILDRAGYGSINKSLIKSEVSVTSTQGLTNDELREIVAERFQRMKVEGDKTAQEKAEAEAATFEWENIENNDTNRVENREPNNAIELIKDGLGL